MNDLNINKIACATEKIATEITLFRIKYQSDSTIRQIKDNFSPSNDLKASIDDQEPKIQKNIDDWRDYLHKYSLILLSELGFFIGLISLNNEVINIADVYIGILFIGISLTVVFIAIFTTIFLQRKILDGNFAFRLYCVDPYIKHPNESNYRDAIYRNLREIICKNKKRYKESNLTKKEKADLIRMIRSDAKFLASMKYAGGTYLWLEKVRFWSTVVILGTSIPGLYMVGWALFGL